jgi:glucose-1-phosphatase
MVEAVVFDMDGVLCRYRRELRLARLAAWSSRSAEAIHAAIWGSGFEDLGERGRLSADDYLKGFGERMGYPLSAEQWIEARRVAIEPDEAVLSLARALGRVMPVGMLTNNPLLLKRHFSEVFPDAAEIFGSRAVFSSELGSVKPEVEAFRRLAARLSVTPEAVLYFDDDESYVAGARAAGLRAERVGGASGVRAGLVRHGVAP